MQLESGKSYLWPVAYSDRADFIQLYPEVDRTFFDGSENDVKLLRSTIASTAQAAFGRARLLVISNAEGLSEISQNTLLRVLEEPHNSLTVVVQTPFSEKLLPTVLSRLTPLKSESVGNDHEVINQESAEIFMEVVNSKDRVGAAKVLCQLVETLKRECLVEPTKNTVNRLSISTKALDNIGRNANYKLALDWLSLHWDDVMG